MTRAFWTIRQNVNGAPSLPVLSSIEYINPCDIWVMPAGSGAANHIHLMAGGFAQANHFHANRHTHFWIKYAGVEYQWVIHETLSATDHSHPSPELRFFLFFMTCSDADYATLTAAPYNVRPIVETTLVNGVPDALIDNVWTASVETFWRTAAQNNLGINLPSQMNRGSQLLKLLLGLSMARLDQAEEALRPKADT